MANSYSSQDCIKGALQRVGEVTDGTSPFHQLAIKYVNQTHKDIIKGNSIFSPENREPWSWARQTNSFQVLGLYNTGTVALVNGSVNGVFSIAPTISLAGYFFQALNQITWYKIATHTASSTAFTLDMGFLEPTNAASVYVAVPLTVDIAASATGGAVRIQRLVEPFRIYQQRVLELGELTPDIGRIYGMDPIEFWKEYPLQLIQNDIPSKFMTVFRSETSWKVQFNKYSTNPLRVDYDYIPFPTDLTDDSSSLPLVPRDDRDLLETGAAYYLFLDKKQKEDAATALQATAAKINALTQAERANSKFYGAIYGQIVPRRDDTAIPYWIVQK